MDILINYAHRPEMFEHVPVEDVAIFVLDRMEKPANTEVSISFVDDGEIARLNELYRGKVGPTDVLSFECDSIEDDEFALAEDSDPESVYQLGDVVIAVDVAERQCTEYGTTFEEEIRVLLTHGLLHLCGYDHIDDDEAEVMEAFEEMLKSEWELEHPSV